MLPSVMISTNHSSLRHGPRVLNAASLEPTGNVGEFLACLGLCFLHNPLDSCAIGDHEFRLPGGQTVRRSCSIGFACLPLSRSHPQAMGWDAVQSLADAALMQAKAEGRDPWIGVLDAGNLSEPELNSAVSAAYRLRSGGLTVQRGGASTNELS